MARASRQADPMQGGSALCETDAGFHDASLGQVENDDFPTAEGMLNDQGVVGCLRDGPNPRMLLKPKLRYPDRDPSAGTIGASGVSPEYRANVRVRSNLHPPDQRR